MLTTKVFSAISGVSIPPEVMNYEVTGLTEDSRKIEKGFIFFALKGVKFDGTLFIEEAFRKGAVLVVTHADYISENRNLPIITHKNPRLVLAKAAANFYGKQPEFIAAVTGTNGKTSVANFVRQIFSLLGKKSASIGTIGVTDSAENDYKVSGSMTTPDPITLFSLIKKIADNGITHLALEASSHGLDQYRLDGLRVKAAAFTNLSRDHLDYHKTMEIYLDAKKRLFAEVLEDGGTAVVNADAAEHDEILSLSKKRNLKTISFGFKGKEIKLTSLKPNANGQLIDFEINGEKFSKQIKLVGDFQASNLLCAAGLVLASGVPAKNIADVLEQITNVDGRMEKAAITSNGAAIFVDYAHTPDGLEKAITTLRAHTKGRISVLFGCGGDRDKGKRPLMGAIASALADDVIITDDNPRSEEPGQIRKEIIAGCKRKNYSEIPDRREAIKFAIAKLKEGDVLLLAGKGHEKTQIIGDKTIEFDDVKMAKEFIR